jgi:hypothetical protein
MFLPTFLRNTGNKKLLRIKEISGDISRKWWRMLFISAIPFLIILTPFLFGNQLFFQGDIISLHYPGFSFLKNSLERRESSVWNPYNFSGFPNFSGLAPLYYIFFQLFSVFTAFNLIVFLNCVGAVFFTWLLCKKFNLVSWAGLMAGLTYVFSQWHWLPDTSISNALPVLPLLFLILWQVKEKKSNWLILLGGLVIGYGWLTVHFNWLVIILSGVFLFALFLSWFDSKKIRVLFGFLAMCLIGTGIGLLVILPNLIYAFLSVREGLPYSQALTEALGPADFIRYILPYFRMPFFDIASGNALLYLGILPLFFLLFALIIKSPLTRFFSFLFFLCLLLSLKYSPLFWLLQELPGFSYFRVPARWMFLGGFSAAILAGFGMNYFLEEGREKWKCLLLKLFKWIGLIIFSVIALFNLIFFFFKEKFILLAQNYFDKHLYAETSGLPLDYYHRFIRGLFSDLEKLFNLFNPQVFLPLFFIFASYFFLKRFNPQRLGTIGFTQIAILIILLNFISVFMFYHPMISKDVVLRQSSTVQFLREHPGRYFTFLPGFTEYSKLTVPYGEDPTASFIFQSELLPPNLNLFYGLESADYYNSIMSRSMSQLLALIGSDRAHGRDKLADLNIPPKEKVKIFEKRKPIVDFLGIKYIISAFPLDEQKFPKVFETSIPPYNISLAIYENREAKPLIYFENGKGDIDLIKRGNNFIDLRVETEKEQFLIFSQNHLPGWRAYLDGKVIKIDDFNDVYIAVLIPAGEHQVYFEYHLPYLWAGN